VESGGRQVLRNLLQTWSARAATFEPEDRETLKAVVSLAPDLSSALSRFATKRHDGAHNLRD
jgi:hypothetical protein